MSSIRPLTTRGPHLGPRLPAWLQVREGGSGPVRPLTLHEPCSQPGPRVAGAEAPDLMGLQETKVVDEAFPAAGLEEARYPAAFSGQRAYNGVALLSRGPRPKW